MKKIIFLDIDGVLAIPSSIKDCTWGLSDDKQWILKRILDATGASIVLTSSWRHNTLEKTLDHMKEEGFWFCEMITGITIRAYQYLEKGTGIHLSIPRGVEIKQWMDTHIHSEGGKNWERKELGKDYTYVILDDDDDMLLEHKDNFIKTDEEIGLSEADAVRAIEILNGKIPE